jgi:hypothetical protein
MTHTGLLEVHGDFRHPQTNLNPKPLTRKKSTRLQRSLLKIKLYAAQRKMSRDVSWVLIPNTAVRGAWKFIRLWILQANSQALWI